MVKRSRANKIILNLKKKFSEIVFRRIFFWEKMEEKSFVLDRKIQSKLFLKTTRKPINKGFVQYVKRLTNDEI